MGTKALSFAWTGLLAACSFDSTGVASAAAGDDVQEGDGSTTHASSDDTTGTSTGGSMSASGTATTLPNTTMDPSTTTPVDTGDPTTDATIDPTQGTSTGGPESMHLQHGTHATCNQPMWCIYNGNLYDPAGGPHAGQECFVSPYPSAQITAIDYDVAAVAAELAYWSLEVYTVGGGMPNTLVQAIPMTGPDATVGHHHVVVEPPIPLSDTRFCVGFRTTGPALQGALGMASSEDSQDPGESWFIADDCSVYYWSDVIYTVGQPRGNWCISVDLESTN